MKAKESFRSPAHHQYASDTDFAQTSKISFRVIIVLVALVGIWGFSCLIISLMKYGLGAVIGGFFGAITGK